MSMKQIPIDEKMRELTQHGSEDFPIEYYLDELFLFPEQTLPLHWHPELEFWKAEGGDNLIQIGSETIFLKDQSAVLIHPDVLHGFRQADPSQQLYCPNIVFKEELIAPVTSRIYQSYVAPLLTDRRIPYILLSPENPWQKEILDCLEEIFSVMKNTKIPCYEMIIQRTLSQIWQILFLNKDSIPVTGAPKNERLLQIRIQKMLTFIHSSYSRPVNLEDIAASAGISRSEASRCFQACLHTSPVNYLLSFRIEMAKYELSRSQDTIEEISLKCGFQTSSYFCRIFRKETGWTPLMYRRMNQILSQ